VYLCKIAKHSKGFAPYCICAWIVLSSFHPSIFFLHSHTIPLFSFSLYSHRLHFLWRCHGAFISPSTRLVLLGTACRTLLLSDVRIPPGYQGATDRNPDYSFSIYIFSHIFQIIILASPLGDLLSPFSSISVLSITPYSAFYLGIKLYSNYLKIQDTSGIISQNAP
jgi:hypothetical protein